MYLLWMGKWTTILLKRLLNSIILRTEITAHWFSALTFSHPYNTIKGHWASWLWNFISYLHMFIISMWMSQKWPCRHCICCLPHRFDASILTSMQDDLTTEEWRLVVKLKKLFEIPWELSVFWTIEMCIVEWEAGPLEASYLLMLQGCSGSTSRCSPPVCTLQVLPSLGSCEEDFFGHR